MNIICESNLIELIILLADVTDPITQRHIDLQYTLVGMGSGPLGDLFALNVLEPALVEADAHVAAQPFLLVMTRQISQLLHLQLVALALVDVRQGRLPYLEITHGLIIKKLHHWDVAYRQI